jgi:hypothetical protein
MQWHCSSAYTLHSSCCYCHCYCCCCYRSYCRCCYGCCSCCCCCCCCCCYSVCSLYTYEVDCDWWAALCCVIACVTQLLIRSALRWYCSPLCCTLLCHEYAVQCDYCTRTLTAHYSCRILNIVVLCNCTHTHKKATVCAWCSYQHTHLCFAD